MRFNLLYSGAITLILSCSPIDTASAAELSTGWYAGGGIGASWLDPSLSNSTYSVGDDKDFAWHLLGGYRINENLSVELAYADLGAAEITSSGTAVGDMDYSQTTASVLWSPTMDPDRTWRSYFRAGINYSDPSWDQDPIIADNWGAFGGIGIEKYFSNDDFALRAEYTAYAKDAQAVNFSVVLYFSD